MQGLICWRSKQRKGYRQLAHTFALLQNVLSAPPLTLKRALTTRVPSQKRNICPRLPSILTPLLLTFHRFAILYSLSRVPCLIIRNKMHLTSRFSFHLSLFFHFFFLCWLFLQLCFSKTLTSIHSISILSVPSFCLSFFSLVSCYVYLALRISFIFFSTFFLFISAYLFSRSVKLGNYATLPAYLLSRVLASRVFPNTLSPRRLKNAELKDRIFVIGNSERNRRKRDKAKGQDLNRIFIIRANRLIVGQ